MPSSYQKFAKDVFIIATTSILTALSGIILLPLLTKTLGAHDYGIWAQVQVTINLALGIVGLGLLTALTRFLAAKTDLKEIREEFYSVFCLVFLVTLIFAIVLITFADSIAGAFFANATQVVQVTGLIILVWSLNLLFLSLFRAFRQMKRYSIFIIADVYGQVGLITYLVLNGYGLLSVFLGILSIRIFILVILFSLVTTQIGIGKPRFLKIKEYLSFGVPTVPGNLASWVITSSDRYVIGYFLGMASVGIYSAGYSIGSIILLFSGVLGFVLPPTLSKLYDEGRLDEVKIHLRYSLKYFLAIGIPFVFGAAMLSKPVLVLFSTAEIANGGYLIPPLIALSILFHGTYIVISNILVLVKKTKIIGLIWVITAVFNLGLNILAVPYLGIMGAALATVLANILAFGTGSYYSFREFRFPIDWHFMIKSLVASGVMVLVVWWLHPQSNLSTIVAVIAGVIVYSLALFLLKGFQKEEISFFRGLFSRGTPRTDLQDKIAKK